MSDLAADHGPSLLCSAERRPADLTPLKLLITLWEHIVVLDSHGVSVASFFNHNTHRHTRERFSAAVCLTLRLPSPPRLLGNESRVDWYGGTPRSSDGPGVPSMRGFQHGGTAYGSSPAPSKRRDLLPPRSPCEAGPRSSPSTPRLRSPHSLQC